MPVRTIGQGSSGSVMAGAGSAAGAETFPAAPAPACAVEPPKPKVPRERAMEAARAVCQRLAPACERLIVAGSLRRGKMEVGDVEIVFIPKLVTMPDPDDLLRERNVTVNQVDEALAAMERQGLLERRKNVNGSETFGPLNKLMRHVATGVPVDLFTANADNWWNYLVCRTGPAESNTRIAMRAQDMGWRWNPYGPGFSRGGGPLGGEREERRMGSEREVFEFVGMEYLEPWRRK